MKNAKFISIIHRHKWHFLIYVLILVAEIKCDDAPCPPTATATPSSSSGAGLLCISECATCPVICSPSLSPANSKPPPSPSLTKPSPLPPSPPVHYYSPSYPYFRGPPTPPISLFPLPLPPASSPPPPATPEKPPPTPSYVSSENVAPPPPPSMIYSGGGGGGNLPSIQQVPPGAGQRNYTYPYYYLYASNAGSLCTVQGSSIFVPLLVICTFYISY